MFMDTCCFTGHREMLLSAETVRERLGLMVNKMIHHGVVRFLTGVAPGFDTMAAEAVLEKRRRHPELRLVLVLSHPGQVGDKAVMAQADEILCTSDRSGGDCLRKRNLWMCSESGYCIAYLERTVGDAADTAGFAAVRGRIVFNIAREAYDRRLTLAEAPVWAGAQIDFP